MSGLLSKEQFHLYLTNVRFADFEAEPFLYRCYVDATEGASDLTSMDGPLSKIAINPLPLILYIVNEHEFYKLSHPDKDVSSLYDNEEYERLIISLSVDKYFTNEHLDYRSSTYANRFSIEISTISLYLNFILGMLSRYKQGDPKETLIVDIMNKGFSMGKCILSLLTEGFETEAFSTWRTLHENESILLVLVKYGQPVIESYLRHLKYALAFRGGLSKEDTDATFLEIKEGMKKADLKSKDMKRYIEYGWLLSIPGGEKIEGLKLNFRDGVERAADLKQYSKVYEMSSEIAHSSPLLIYSRKNYFYLITILNLYESFFRLEKVFSSLYLSTVSKEDVERYVAMRRLYFGELSAAYEIEKKRFESLLASGKKDELPPKNAI